MAADVARMMADLGLAHRELVSAPDVDGRGRAIQRNRYADEAVQREVENRRELYSRSGEGKEDLRAARMRAWNSE